MSSAFERLHPAVQHHVVNSLGWRSLRPLQEAAVEPVLQGAHALLIAPTAGGKTEASIFPTLSRMLEEKWSGLSVLYLCPIKALLNNLEPRLSKYAELLGRRVGIWHGDVGQAARKRIVAERPDLLLTTPESLEAMLIFRPEDRQALFKNVRCVIVDELHAFAGDYRGWHLLAVLERIGRIAEAPIQRLGLSATVGNPQDLLAWFAGSAPGEQQVIEPPAPPVGEADVQLDYVGSLSNAATLISRLHRGEKRLVFCDSRARVESLSAELQELGVKTFVSHSSLSLDQRRRAEAAFQDADDCVIVATSTLELGVDVGDLDRVIQLDAPTTVASFLQRMGRTGRRSGTSRNCLFLATSERAFLQAAGLLQLWSEGYVEPVEPPPKPLHIVSQQILAIVLQEKAVGRHTWREWLGALPKLTGASDPEIEATLDHMVTSGWLFEESGLLSMGGTAEETLGRRNFLELCSVFTSPPLFKVLHGRNEVGFVHQLSFQARKDEQPILVLGGRSWEVTHLDWRRKQAFVTPTKAQGRSRWAGSAQALHFRLCRAIRHVLATDRVPVRLTQRAQKQLEERTHELHWVDDQSTALVRDPDGKLHWWTFAGLLANRSLAHALGDLCESQGATTDLSLRLQPQLEPPELREALASLKTAPIPPPPADEDALKGLKFSASLPLELAIELLERSMADREGTQACVQESVRSVSIVDS